MIDFGGEDLVLVKEFRASPSELYRAWSEPEELAGWMGPPSVDVHLVEVDLRPGGAYRIVMRFPEGVEYSWGGRYLELNPPTRLAFTVEFWGEDGKLNRENPTQITVSFEAVGDKTRMTFRQSPFPPGVDREGHADGWIAAFEKLAGFLEAAGRVSA